MEKAIEIKRRAQRCIQNGDLDGALNEYEKLVQAPESDPYNFVLLADLLFKRGDAEQAVQRYLAAVGSYEKAGLFKNAIAVCKKMMRLSLAPAKVLERLAALHALDGLGTEAALYYMQYAETLVRDGHPKDAADALQKAFDASPDEVKALERMSEAWTLADDPLQAARAMGAAAYAYHRLGRLDQVDRCARRADQLHGGTMKSLASERGPLPSLRVEDEDVSIAPPVLSAEESATEPSATHAPDASPSFESHRMDGLVGTMAPPATPAHLPAVDLDLERIPHGVLGASPPAAPPRLDLDGAPTTPAPDSALDDGPHGPPRLPDSALSAGGDGEAGLSTDASGDVVAAEDAGEPVYEIDANEGPAYAIAETDAVDGIADAGMNPPSLEAPVAEVMAEAGDEADAPALAAEADDEVTGADAAATSPAGEPRLTIAEIEALLSGAQERFRTGDRDGAASLLVDAALAYERADRLDNAASIFRSLARGPQTTNRLLELWLSNCERRADAREAAEVACELGDRSLNDGDFGGARGWFERAVAHDAGNAVAQRRLARLAEMAPADAAPGSEVMAVAPAPASEPVAAFEPAAAAEPEAATSFAAAPAAAEPEMTGEGRVEMSVGRAEAVSFDLGALLSEFQRGIAAQLSGDAQSHYDLAMTYHEMGLHQQAIDGFRLAAADPAFAFRAAEMIGRCLLDQGRFDEAVHEFSEALRSPKLAPEAVLGLRYQLGLAREAAGDLAGALAEFERVFEQQANYSDVALKLRALRTSLGQS